ncbi:MAG TPA: hypothetical protein VLJ17_18715 [Xanthobacteraceae bacterium]|nr:hypothetical protein [Xanthobacteraceae bacterium]
MRKLTIAAATIAFGALLTLGPALAEVLHGGPVKNGSQCFNYGAGTSRDGRFGTWGACPQTASTAVAPATKKKTSNGSASR